jgi:hypothetical protein
VLDWVSTNASAVQAFAALASLLVAAILAGLTAWYVKLTHAIAQSSLEQVRHLKQLSDLSRRKDALAAESLARRIRVPLADIRDLPPNHDRLRSYAQLAERDIGDLQSLARSVGGDAISHAAKAAVSLRSILNLLEKNRAVDVRVGWIPQSSELEEWRTALEAAPRMLELFEDVCREAGK